MYHVSYFIVISFSSLLFKVLLGENTHDVAIACLELEIAVGHQPYNWLVKTDMLGQIYPMGECSYFQ